MPEPQPIRLAICLGSSCFARGNKLLLENVEKRLARNGWRDLVRISGLRCENRCGAGPNIKINDTLHQGLDSETVMDILAKLIAAETCKGGE